MTENVCSLFDNLSKHNSRDYGYELSKSEIVQILKIFDDVKELEQYRAIGTVKDFKALKENNEPKKPYSDQKGLLDTKMWYCPVCKKEVISDWNRDLANDYCHNCGQKLDWQ